MKFVIQKSIDEKETQLKELVIKLLKEKNFSDYDLLDSLFAEVFAGGLLSIIAGIFALMNGAYIVGAIILGISITVTSLWMVLFFLSSKRTFQVPTIFD